MQSRSALALAVLVVSLSACGADSDFPNDVSEPTIDQHFAVDPDGRQLALLCYGEGSPTVFLEPGDGGSGDEFTFIMPTRGTDDNVHLRSARIRSKRPAYPGSADIGRCGHRPTRSHRGRRPSSPVRSCGCICGRIHCALPRVALPRRRSGSRPTRRCAGRPRGRAKFFRARKRGGTPFSTSSTLPVE